MQNSFFVIFFVFAYSVPKYSDYIVNHSLRIWSQSRSSLELKDLSMAAPITWNILFLPSLQGEALETFKALGLIEVENLYLNDNFASFTKLQEKCYLHNS